MADDAEQAKRDQGRSLAAEEWAIHTLMSDYNGRRYLAEMLDHLGHAWPRYKHDGDPYGTMWRDGFAAAGQTIFAQIERHAPAQYQQLVRERRTRKEREQEAAILAMKSGGPEIPSGETFAEDVAARQERKYNSPQNLGKPSAEGTKSGS